MKVVEVRFRPLGRKVNNSGDYYQTDVGLVRTDGNLDAYGQYAAFERTEVEVEVEDAVPSWLNTAIDNWRDDIVTDKDFRRHMANAFRTHVESRAKAAAERMDSEEPPAEVGRWRAWRERIILEEFLKP